jgi:GAF domain-containing protein
MNTHFTLDRESFQNLLARASLAQEYLDSERETRPAVDLPPKPAIEQPKRTIPVDYIQSLSAIAAIQRSIATDDVDVDGAMALIADQARNVANANGIVIGLLEGDNLVYRAGSGIAATYIGRHVKATLSVSRANGEILRVENTQTDARIEAAICRQFGSKALLIVPICRGRTVAGTIEILFYDAHAFQDREVRTYQLMAGLVAEAISRAAELKQPLAAEEREEHAHSAAARGATEAEGGEWSVLRRWAGVGAMIAQSAKRLLLHQYQWKPIAVVMVLVIAGWIAYIHRGPASPVSTSELARSNAIEQQVPFAPAKPAANSMSKPQTEPVATQKKKKAARTTSQRPRVWRDVDYIAEDVTVRHVKLKPAVAVAPQKRPMGSAVQPHTQRIPPPKVVHAAEKPEIKQISVQQHKTCGQEHLGFGRRLVCWLHKIFPTHKLPDNSRKEGQTPDFSYIAEDPVR